MTEEKINTTQELAVEFVQRAVSEINKQLAVEIERNGFSMEKIRKGKTKLVREVTRSDTNSCFVMESFSVPVGKDGFKRTILAVKWLKNSFQIEVNSDSVANAVKANPLFKVKKVTSDRPALVTGNMTKREIEIEARANKYMEDSQKSKK